MGPQRRSRVKTEGTESRNEPPASAIVKFRVRGMIQTRIDISAANCVLCAWVETEDPAAME